MQNIGESQVIQSQRPVGFLKGRGWFESQGSRHNVPANGMTDIHRISIVGLMGIHRGFLGALSVLLPERTTAGEERVAKAWRRRVG